MLLKWLIFGAIIYAVYTLFFKSKRVDSSNMKENDISESEEMVECTMCGTFVSSKDAYIKNGKFYCSKECMLKG